VLHASFGGGMNNKQSFSFSSFFATLPSIGAILLPAATCPACWPAYAGLLSSFGVSFIDYTPWLMPIIVVLMMVSLGALAWQSKKRENYKPLMLGVAGVIILVVGKFQLELDSVVYAGAALLIIASIWNSWPEKMCAIEKPDHCNDCE